MRRGRFTRPAWYSILGRELLRMADRKAPTREDLLELILSVLASCPKREGAPDACASETQLIGNDGVLDSLGLVSLITGVEQRIDDEYGIALAIAIDDAVADTAGPLRTAQALAAYIENLVAAAE